MKINFRNINFRHLLFLPLLTFVMAATNPCDGGGITVSGGVGGQGNVTAVLDTQTTFANTIKITIPADSEITDLNVNATDDQTGETQQVLQITGLSPGEERTVTIPKLKREHSYRIDLIVPETGDIAATLNLDSLFRVVFSNRSATNNWGFVTGGTSQYGIVGGGYDQGPPYSQGILFPAGTAAASINAAVNADPIQPDFDIVLLKGEKENRSVQPAGPGFYDFDENGVLDLVMADPSASNQHFELEAGRLYILMNSIPTQDFELKDSTYILEGDDPDYRFASDTDFDPITGYFGISVPGGSTINAPCNGKPKCGYCSLYDFKEGIFLTNIHTDGILDDRRCRYMKFWDPDIDGVMGLVYLITNDIWGDHRSCRQVGVNADSITDPGTPLFTEAVGDRNCGLGPLIIQKLDFNGDGHLDLSITRLLSVPATGWETFIWYAGLDFNPAVFNVKFAGDPGEYGGFWFKVDFNNDGVDEIINLLQNHMHIYYDGIESSPDIIPRSTPGSAGWFADFNGDGYTDLFGCFTDISDSCRAFIMY